MKGPARHVRALVIDDEPLARKRLVTLLADEPDVEVIGEAGTGSTAVRLITTHAPDLVLLDVQMPGLDGFGVLREVSRAHLPVVIFVTAYDEHAIRAFEVGAVDYLLKPVEEARFRASIRRAVARVWSTDREAVSAQLGALLDRLSPAARQDRIPVRSASGVAFVRVRDIDWAEAMDDHVRLHAGKETHVLRETMAQVEARLPSSRFLRIHRSTLVNLDRILEVKSWFKGDYVIVLQDGTRLTSGRTYRARVQQLLK